MVRPLPQLSMHSVRGRSGHGPLAEFGRIILDKPNFDFAGTVKIREDSFLYSLNRVFTINSRLQEIIVNSRE